MRDPVTRGATPGYLPLSASRTVSGICKVHGTFVFSGIHSRPGIRSDSAGRRVSGIRTDSAGRRVPGFCVLASVLGFALALALTLVLPAAPVFAQDAAAASKTETYPILLQRPSAVGDRFEFEAEAELLQEEAFYDGPEQLDSGLHTAWVKLEAIGEVVAVDERGGIVKAYYEVKDHQARLRGNPLDGLLPGSVIVAETVDGITILSLQEGALAQAHAVILAQVLETARPGAPSDDDLFGSEAPRAVGESWPVHEEQVYQAFLNGGLVLPPGEIEGKATLERKTEVEGSECVHVAGSVSAANVRPADVKPEEVEFSELSLRFEGDYPLDPELPALTGKIETRFFVKLVFDRGSAGSAAPLPPSSEEGTGAGGEAPAPRKVYTEQLTETKKSFRIRPLHEASNENETEASPESPEEASASSAS